jgi:hypothetical protein
LAGISRQTLEDHHKLYEGYVSTVDERPVILAGFDYAELEGNQVSSPRRSVSVDRTVRKAAAATHGWVITGYHIDGGSVFNHVPTARTCGPSTTWSRCWRSTSTSTPTRLTSAPRPTGAHATSRRSAPTGTGTTSSAKSSGRLPAGTKAGWWPHASRRMG